MQQMKIEMKSTDRWKHYPMFVVIQFQWWNSISVRLNQIKFD
jgi:hypothetical protein